VPSARIVDVANVLIGDRSIDVQEMGIRPGEKIHEILISEEEMFRTVIRGDYFAILPSLSELREHSKFSPVLEKEYSSADALMQPHEVHDLLTENELML